MSTVDFFFFFELHSFGHLILLWPAALQILQCGVIFVDVACPLVFFFVLLTACVPGTKSFFDVPFVLFPFLDPFSSPF
jgi:hypothetical protein